MMREYKLQTKHKLPHIQPQNSMFFITFRLHFPAPEKFLLEYNLYKDSLEREYQKREPNPESAVILKKKLFAFNDDFYDKYSGKFNITDHPEVARAISDRIIELQNQYYYLHIFTLMPNHVHILLKPNVQGENPYPLEHIVRMIKGGSARMANQLLDRSGSFWNRDYYDYWVRNQKELFRIFEYIRQNPVKAKLVSDPLDWKWTWINPDFLENQNAR